MEKLVCVLLGLVVFYGIVQDDEKATIEAIKRTADELGQAFMKGDYAKLADLTYPKVVDAFGGRDRMIAETEKLMKNFQSQGLAYLSYSVAEPSEILAEGPNTFAVTPITIEMTVPRGKAIAKSYLLAISTDECKTWTFVDGSGIDTQEKRDKLLPKLPAKLKLPEKQKPEFISDK